MPVRLKKLVGMFAILAFCTLYVAAVVTLSDCLPDHWLARLAYYTVAGIAWGLPLFPLIKWMNKEPS